MKFINLKTLASVSAAAALATGTALAQQPTQPQQPATPQQAQPQIEPVSDTEITRFVAANEKVNMIASKMNEKLESVETQEEIVKVQTDTEKKMVTAIESEGLSATRFNEIIRLTQVDPATNKKVVSAMEG